MRTHEQIEERILEVVSDQPNQRIRPVTLERELREELGISLHAIKAALNDLVQEESLVFTYRDPCSYVEIPVAESHRPARPMKVIRDGEGEYWICDAEVDDEQNPAEQGCWRCGGLPFTRND
jgi:hypothetical protein